jgi:hypothetical protein
LLPLEVFAELAQFVDFAQFAPFAELARFAKLAQFAERHVGQRQRYCSVKAQYFLNNFAMKQTELEYAN